MHELAAGTVGFRGHHKLKLSESSSIPPALSMSQNKVVPTDERGDYSMALADDKALRKDASDNSLSLSPVDGKAHQHDSGSETKLSDLMDGSTGKLSLHGVTQFVALEKEVCRAAMTAIGGLDKLAAVLKVDISKGLTPAQVEESRASYGRNQFPESPMDSYLELWLGAMQDPVLLILLAAAAVSLGLGIWQHGAEEGWVEGGSIFIAVFLVSNLAASNDYSKQYQFAALEKSSAADELCSVKRNGIIELINPMELVVGDIIVLQAGDKIPADCIIADKNVIMSSQASLTGEPEDLKKSIRGDFAMYSACLITASEDKIEALVMGTGENSQWGKIKANLVVESVNTPLQEKLEVMTGQIGYIGMIAALGTFIALVIRIWAGVEPSKITQTWITDGVVQAFILAVTIVVVAIPEGLPLAVTIALAYSTKKMYKDQCFIRVLAACETMGNATNICSDKTGETMGNATNICSDKTGR